MIKTAPVDYAVIEPIRERWSPYAFDTNKPVEPEKLNALLEAARWAASASNEQPWLFLVGDREKTPETWQKIFSTLVDFNKAWAKNVPVLILPLARLQFERNGNENPTALYDTGMAVQNLVLQAVAEGLHTHQMGGYDRAKARELFAIPETIGLTAVVAVGYDAPTEILEDEKLRDRNSSTERTRKSLQTIILDGAGDWGAILPLVTTEN